MNFKKQFMEGLLTKNPVTVQLLGMCSTLAITTSFFNGLGMGVSVTIILTLSKGPEPTEPPATTAPTQPTEVTKSIIIALPADRTEEYNLSIEFEEEMVVNAQITPGTATYEFSLTGSGSGEFMIFIDGELLRTETVNFNA